MTLKARPDTCGSVTVRPLLLSGSNGVYVAFERMKYVIRMCRTAFPLICQSLSFWQANEGEL